MAAINSSVVDDWLEEDNLMLLECWSRDGYTVLDIANKIGINVKTLREWRKRFPEIRNAMNKGREIVDYKVENALLKSALGYRTKEVKVTTLMRFGKVVETTKEVTEKDQTPNVTACQVWLYNRLPDKWKKNRDAIVELDEEDQTIQVTVTRASDRPKVEQENNSEEDKEWQDEINNSITIRKKEEEETKSKQSKTLKKPVKTSAEPLKSTPNNVSDNAGTDLDYWPDDWEEE